MVFIMVTSYSKDDPPYIDQVYLDPENLSDQVSERDRLFKSPKAESDSQSSPHSLKQAEELVEITILALSSLGHLVTDISTVIKDEYHKDRNFFIHSMHHFEQFANEVDFLVSEAELYDKNLLLGEAMNVSLNQEKESFYTVSGQNVSATALNIKPRDIQAPFEKQHSEFYRSLLQAQQKIATFKTSLLISNRILSNRLHYITQRCHYDHNKTVTYETQQPSLNSPYSLTKLISDVSVDTMEPSDHLIGDKQTQKAEAEEIVYEIIETLETLEQNKEINELYTKYDSQSLDEQTLDIEKKDIENNEGFLTSFFHSDREEKTGSGIRTILDRLQETEEKREAHNHFNFEDKKQSLNEISSKILKYIDKKHYKILESSTKDLSDIIYSEALSTTIIIPLSGSIDVAPEISRIRAHIHNGLQCLYQTPWQSDISSRWNAD